MTWFSRKPTEDIRLTVLREEAWRRQDSQGRRLSTIETIGGVLTGGAALVSTIITVLPPTPVLRLGLVLSLAAAVFAIAALVPRKIIEINLEKLKKKMKGAGPLKAQDQHFDALVGQINAREKLIGARFRLVRMGLYLLAGTILCVVLSIAISWGGGDDMGRNDDEWSGEVTGDPSIYETVSESGNPEVILGTAGDGRGEEILRLTERDQD